MLIRYSKFIAFQIALLIFISFGETSTAMDASKIPTASTGTTTTLMTNTPPPVLRGHINNQTYVQDELIPPLATAVAFDSVTYYQAQGLPAGLDINPNTGQIIGAAMAAEGAYLVTIIGSNEGSGTLVTTNFMINIIAPDVLRATTAAIHLRVLEDDYLDINLNSYFVNLDNTLQRPFSVDYAHGENPWDLWVNYETGILDGNIGGSIKFEVIRVTAHNANGETALLDVVISVFDGQKPTLDPNKAPKINSSGIPTLAFSASSPENIVLSVDEYFSDAKGYAVSGYPAGLTFNQEEDNTGDHKLKRDGNTLQASAQPYYITVTAYNDYGDVTTGFYLTVSE